VWCLFGTGSCIGPRSVFVGGARGVGTKNLRERDSERGSNQLSIVHSGPVQSGFLAYFSNYQDWNQSIVTN
jgi:hypothetical protein